MYKSNLFKKRARALYLLTLPLILSGCQALWSPSADFGSSVTQAIRSQAVNPDEPAIPPLHQKGMDGPAAKASIDNYIHSFEQRPNTVNSGYGGMVITNPSSGQLIDGNR